MGLFFMSQNYKRDDFYKRKAREEKYPSRSVYKLKEIDAKYKLIKKGDLVLDLGCAPGSWLLYISKKIGDRGRIVGVDVDDIKVELPENAVFLKKDIMSLRASDLIKTGGKYQAVVSDSAPATSGIDFVDVERSLELCEKALEIATEVLEDGGNFLCKIFEGEGSEEFYKKVKQNFKFSKRFRPQATRKQSREIYIAAKEFKGICVKI
jgi:23S rRNA (uridine2552-2'-O)-methyltransferase